jgi:hypothetical protein
MYNAAVLELADVTVHLLRYPIIRVSRLIVTRGRNSNKRAAR